jgi:chitinase
MRMEEFSAVHFRANLAIRGLFSLLWAVVCCGQTCAAPAGGWVTAYYPAYHQANLPPEQIDFSALTHVIHFAVMPQTNGALDTAANGLTRALSADLISSAHAAGRKVLICAGGSDSAPGFRAATAATNLASFISGLVDFMSTSGYDGVDLDWEPLVAADADQFTNLVYSLRSALDQFNPRPLLTVATASEPELFAVLQAEFDQINLMTYDLAGPWEGWVTWFNAPIYSGGYRFANGRLIESADGIVTNFVANGVSPGKLGLGLCFYGRVWTHGAGTPTGGTLLPRQSWTNTPTVTAYTFAEIMSGYYQPASYHWDAAAQAAYLSITNAVATNDIFLSYDDEYACQAKVSYARNQQLGGLIIWELTQGYRATQPAGQREPLLQAVAAALATPGPLAIQTGNDGVHLSFASAPLALYRVLWTDHLGGSNWNTLTNNLPGVFGTAFLTDPSDLSVPGARFYRVQTPP